MKGSRNEREVVPPEKRIKERGREEDLRRGEEIGGAETE